MSKCHSCHKHKCKCRRLSKHCRKAFKKRAKHTFVAGANCCSSHKNIFTC